MTEKDIMNHQSRLSRRIWRYSYSPGVIRLRKNRDVAGSRSSIGVLRRSFPADIFRRWISPENGSWGGKNYSNPFVSPLFSSKPPGQPLGSSQLVNRSISGKNILGGRSTELLKVAKDSPQGVHRLVEGKRVQTIQSLENPPQTKIQKLPKGELQHIQTGNLTTPSSKTQKNTKTDMKLAQGAKIDLSPKDTPVLQKKKEVNNSSLSPQAQLNKLQTVGAKDVSPQINFDNEVEGTEQKNTQTTGEDQKIGDLSLGNIIAVKEPSSQPGDVKYIYRKPQSPIQTESNLELPVNDPRTMLVSRDRDSRVQRIKSPKEFGSPSIQGMEKSKVEAGNVGRNLTIFPKEAESSAKIQKQYLDLTPGRNSQTNNNFRHNDLDFLSSENARRVRQKPIFIGGEQILNRKEDFDKKDSTSDKLEITPNVIIKNESRINPAQLSLGNRSLNMISRKTNRNINDQSNNSEGEKQLFNNPFVPFVFSNPFTETVYRQVGEIANPNINQGMKSKNTSATANEGSVEDEKSRGLEKGNANKDADEIADQVFRKLLRQLEVEKERKGLRKWH